MDLFYNVVIHFYNVQDIGNDGWKRVGKSTRDPSSLRSVGMTTNRNGNAKPAATATVTAFFRRLFLPTLGFDVRVRRCLDVAFAFKQSF
jgi:hypothetical protein